MKTSPALVAHVVFRFGVGGLENGIVNLVNHLPRDRWRHAIVSLTAAESVVGGEPLKCRVDLSEPPPPDGPTVVVASDNPEGRDPAVVRNE